MIWEIKFGTSDPLPARRPTRGAHGGDGVVRGGLRASQALLLTVGLEDADHRVRLAAWRCLTALFRRGVAGGVT